MEQRNEAVMQAQPGKRLAEAPPKKGGRVWKLVVGAVLAAAVIFYGACCYLAHSSSTFFPHTYINGVAVGGLTQSDAETVLTRQLEARTVELTFSGEDAPFVTTPLSELLTEEPVNISGIADAYAAQRRGLFSGGWRYLRCLFSSDRTVLPYQWDETALNIWAEATAQQVSFSPEDASVEITDGKLMLTTARDGRQVDPSELRASILSLSGHAAIDSYGFTLQPEILPAKTLTAREIYNQLHGAAQNATYDAATDSIVPEQPGADFDVTAAQAVLDAASPGETVTLDAVIEAPEVTAAELEQVLFRDVLGEAKTKVGGTAGRKTNVKLSAAAINGYVMNSGDVFSYNEAVGQRTAANGYQPAPAYVKGETVDEIGGGICQTSSTLYLACLRGNLEITERYAHRYIPSYIAAGMDATVSWGGPDYKFTNDTKYPLKIVTSYENGYLTIKLLGTNATGITAKMTNEKLSSTDFEVIYEESAEQAPGTQSVKTTAYTGSKWRTYRHLYDAYGKLISSAYEATSDYKARNKVILVAPGELPGADPVAPPAEPSADTTGGASGQSETVPAQEPETIVVPTAPELPEDAPEPTA